MGINQINGLEKWDTIGDLIVNSVIKLKEFR